jgi:hypothetical protein
MKRVLAAFAFLLFAAPCKAALSPKQLGAAILDPVAGASLPLETKFASSTGAALTLGEAIGDKSRSFWSITPAASSAGRRLRLPPTAYHTKSS